MGGSDLSGNKNATAGGAGLNVTAALNNVFAPHEVRGAYTRSATTNVVMLAGSGGGSDLDAVIDAMAVLYPGRYFVVSFDAGVSELKVEASARCVGLAALEAVCSEVVKVTAPLSQMQAVPSVLRGSLLTGCPAAAFLYDAGVSLPAFDLIAPMCESLIFDSSRFADRLGFLKNVGGRFARIVDLEWIGLGLWREQIKSAFGRPAVCELLCGLKEVKISAAVGKPPKSSMCAPLMAGWIVDRLGMEIWSRGEGGISCSLPAGNPVKLSIETRTEERELGLTEVVFQGDGGVVTFRRGVELETVIEMNERFSTSVPFEDESTIGRLQRYYGIGEATFNYLNSFNKGLRLLEML